MTKNISNFIIGLFTVVLIQEFGLSRLTLFQVSPDLVTIFLAFAAININQKASTSFGFAAGILAGILSGNLGLNMLTRTCEGFIAGYFNIPEDCHATAKQKTKRLYGAVATAGFLGNVVFAIGYNPLGLPPIYRIFVSGVLESLFTLLLAVIITRFFLRQSLAD